MVTCDVWTAAPVNTKNVTRVRWCWRNAKWSSTTATWRAHGLRNGRGPRPREYSSSNVAAAAAATACASPPSPPPPPPIPTPDRPCPDYSPLVACRACGVVFRGNPLSLDTRGESNENTDEIKRGERRPNKKQRRRRYIVDI